MIRGRKEKKSLTAQFYLTPHPAMQQPDMVSKEIGLLEILGEIYPWDIFVPLTG